MELPRVRIGVVARIAVVVERADVAAAGGGEVLRRGGVIEPQ